MTEEEWEACGSVGQALQAVNRLIKSANAGRRRKFRLLGCYSLRRLQPLALNDLFGRALDIAELVFDGETPLADLRAAVGRAQEGYAEWRSDLEDPGALLAQDLDSLLADHPYAAASRGIASATLQHPARIRAFNRGEVLGSQGEIESSAELAQLVRELFGNPFRPVAFDPEWRTSNVVSLAKSMYEARDFSAMPILSDALQDAGCEQADILDHCRGPGPHVRGCWVVDLVLGKA
jgi:hypothetical protein